VCVVEGAAENAPQGAVDLGIVAIETSTGDVLHAQFRSAQTLALCSTEDSMGLMGLNPVRN
jgi:hypothetical protein